MTKNTKVIHNYANALFNVLKNNSDINYDIKNLNYFAEVLKSDIELYNIFISPVTNKFIKLKIINSIKDLNKIDTNFLESLIKNHRESYIFDILEQTSNLISLNKKLKTITVVSASKIDTHEQEGIFKLLSDQNHPNLELKYEIDNSLLGGIVLKDGSTQIDYSLKGCIEILKNIPS